MGMEFTAEAFTEMKYMPAEMQPILRLRMKRSRPAVGIR